MGVTWQLPVLHGWRDASSLFAFDMYIAYFIKYIYCWVMD